MAKDPRARIPSPGALAATAREVLSGRSPAGVHPAEVHPAASPTLLAPAAQSEPTRVRATFPPDSAAPQAKPDRTKALLIAGGVAATLLLAAGGIAWGLTTDSRSPEPASVAESGTPAPVTITQTQAVPTTVTSAASQTRTSTPQRGVGGLGLSTPISTPTSDGTTITVVYNAVAPGSYADEVAAALAQYPGASYLRTDQSCSSLKQSENGNPIYAVDFAGTSLADTCANKARSGGGAYTRRLDDTTPVGTELC